MGQRALHTERRAGVGDSDHRRREAWVPVLSTRDEGVGRAAGLPDALHAGLGLDFSLW